MYERKAPFIIISASLGVFLYVLIGLGFGKIIEIFQYSPLFSVSLLFSVYCIPGGILMGIISGIICIRRKKMGIKHSLLYSLMLYPIYIVLLYAI